jgi:hypothetical protein
MEDAARYARHPAQRGALFFHFSTVMGRVLLALSTVIRTASTPAILCTFPGH